MASSRSKKLAQIAIFSNPQQAPTGCGLCKTGTKISCKCLQCDLLLCENCRHQHLEEETNKDHRVHYMKYIGMKFEILSVKSFNVELSYTNCVLPDKGDKLWIGSYKYGELYHIQLQDKDMTIINKINMKVRDMARLSQNKILLSVGESRLCLLDIETGEDKDSVYDISPFKSSGLSTTQGNNIIVCCHLTKPSFRYAVMVFNKDGTRMAVYKHDQHNKQIFTGPESITISNNGYIHVVDNHYCPNDNEGRVIVLDRNGHVITRYTGHPDINKDYPFHPNGIVITQADRVIIADYPSDALHILDNTGQLVTFINTKDKGILCPQSLAFMDDGHLLIGCNDIHNEVTKFHKVRISNI